MKISETIKNLKEIVKQYGDLDCWSAKDDEGNGYDKIHFDPTVMFRPCDETDLRNLEELDEYKQEHIAGYENGENDEEYEPLQIEYVVCLN